MYRLGAVEALLNDVIEARRDLLAALEELPAEKLDVPGLVGEWSARELIAHLGYWVGHAVEAIHLAEQGRAAEFEVGDDEVEARNAVVARVARESGLATVQARERASFEALVQRLQDLDPALLDVRLADWGTLGEGIREDGPAHYREHAEQLRAAAGRSADRVVY